MQARQGRCRQVSWSLSGARLRSRTPASLWFLSLEEGGEGRQGGYGRGNVVRAKRGSKAGAEGSVDIFYRKHDGCFTVIRRP